MTTGAWRYLRMTGAAAAIIGGGAISAVTAVAAHADTGQTPNFVQTWGGPGHAPLYPSGVAVAPDGTVVVSDIGNDQISKFDPTTSQNIWTVGSYGSGTSQFADPRDVAVDASGEIFVADNSNGRVDELSSTGAWLGSFNGSSTDKMGPPIGLTVINTSSGTHLYVADPANQAVREYNAVGHLLAKYTSNGACVLTNLRDATADANGNVYVANYTKNNVVVFSASGTCLTTWGSKGSGPGQFMNPYGIAVANDPVLGQPAVYVADSNNERIQEFTLSGTFVAQLGGPGGDTQPGTFTALRRVAVDGNGNVWGADPWGYRIEQFQRTSTGYSYAQTIGGQAPPTSSTAVFNDPNGVSPTGGGGLVVADTTNQRIDVFNSAGTLATTCGNRGDGSGQFNWPRGVAVNTTTNQIWVADTRQSDLQVMNLDCSKDTRFAQLGTGLQNLDYPTGIVYRSSDQTMWIADSRNNRVVSYNGATRAPIAAFGTLGSGTGQFDLPEGIGVDPTNGNAYVADTNNNRIVELSDTGGSSIAVVRTLTDGFNKPQGVALDSTGNIYVADTGNNRMVVLNSSGSEIATVSTGISAPAGVATDASNDIFLTDSRNDRVQEYRYSGSYGMPTYVKTFLSPSASDMYPVDVASTATSYYVADPGLYRVEQIDRSTGQIVATIGGVQGNGPGQFGAMRAIAVDGAGNIYVADTPNNRIEKFSSNLTFVSTWGKKGSGPGQFINQAYGVAVGPGLDANGQPAEVVYAVDGGGRVFKYDTSGNYISTFVSTGLLDPRQAVVDPHTGDLYVDNARAHDVLVYREDGTLRMSFGSSGKGNGQFTDDMRGIAITADGSEVLVTDAGDYRVEAFSTFNGAYLWQMGSQGTNPGQFGGPRGLATTSDGTLVVSDEWGFGLDLFQMTPATNPTGATFEQKLFGQSAPLPGVNSPRGMLVDSTGRLYVNDWWNQRVERINADGTGVMSWGSRGIQQSVGLINFAWDVAQQPCTGDIFVANRENHQIVAYDANGNYLQGGGTHGTYGSRGTNNGQFQFPQSVAFDPTNGNLLVADSGNNRIQRFSVSCPTDPTYAPSLTWLASYGSLAGGSTPGQFQTPVGLSVAPDGTLWVADTANNRVQSMSPSGTWNAFSTVGTAGNLHVPWGVTVAPDGSIWIADTGNNRIVSMTAAGKLNFSATGAQMGAGDLNSPFEVVFNPVNGYAYISDTFNSRVIEINP